MDETIFLERRKNYKTDEDSFNKLVNELHFKVKKCVKRKPPCACVFYFPN